MAFQQTGDAWDVCHREYSEDGSTYRDTYSDRTFLWYNLDGAFWDPDGTIQPQVMAFGGIAESPAAPLNPHATVPAVAHTWDGSSTHLHDPIDASAQAGEPYPPTQSPNNHTDTVVQSSSRLTHSTSAVQIEIASSNTPLDENKERNRIVGAIRRLKQKGESDLPDVDERRVGLLPSERAKRREILLAATQDEDKISHYGVWLQDVAAWSARNKGESAL